MRAQVSSHPVCPCASLIVCYVANEDKLATVERRVTHDRMALLYDLVHRDQGLERLNFIREYRLHSESVPERYRRVVVPCIDDTLCKVVM